MTLGQHGATTPNVGNSGGRAVARFATVEAKEAAREAALEAARAKRRDGVTRGFAAAARCAKGALDSAAARRGIAEARLISQWPEIVGERIAKVCRPERVKHRRGLALGGVLVLAVEGASATELEFLAPQIIERVNAGYGYGAITDIAFTQAHGPLPPIGRATADAAVRPEDLPRDTRQRLEALTRPVEDDALRDALTRLGANVMSRGEKGAAEASMSRGSRAGR